MEWTTVLRVGSVVALLIAAVIAITVAILVPKDRSQPTTASVSLTDSRVFNPAFYFQSYEDLRAGNDFNVTRLANHWLTNGTIEGRIAHADFSIVDYLNRYPDLKKVFQSNYTAAFIHYLTYGIAQKRNGLYGKRGAWSDPQSWDSGVVPSLSSNETDVVIPSERIIVLDSNIAVRSLTIRGTLRCAENKDLSIVARWILVRGGRFECGTANRLFTGRLNITLVGESTDPSVDEVNMGSKFFGSWENGVISLHGALNTQAWQNIAQTAVNGSRTILTASQPLQFKVNQQIVVSATAPDQYDGKAHEVRTITAVKSATGSNGESLSELTLNAPLEEIHHGITQQFSNDRRVWIVKSYAEIGLLTQNIVIQGDEGSEDDWFGGHMFAKETGQLYISSVQVYRMGQRGILGRYPVHWHMTDDVHGQYVRYSSIWRSYSRCVTIHNAHRVEVKGNTCYNHLGHGFFIEDGVETGNVFEGNLAIWTRKPDTPYALLESDNLSGLAARGPASFWITNGNNTFRNNVGVGSEGACFWYDTSETPTGPSKDLAKYTGLNPRQSPFGSFDNNVAHNCDMAFSSCSFAGGPVGYEPSNGAAYKNLTIYSSGPGSVWPCWGKQTFHNMILIDTGVSDINHQASFVSPSPLVVTESLFVANSALASIKRSRTALGIYDFGVDFDNCHFEAFNTTSTSRSYLFVPVGTAIRETDNTIRKSTLKFVTNFMYSLDDERISSPDFWGALMYDLDGSLGFGGPGVVVTNSSMMYDDSCNPIPNGGWFCPQKYVGIMIWPLPQPENPFEVMLYSRSDKPSITFPVIEQNFPFWKNTVAINKTSSYHYTHVLNTAWLQQKSINKLQLLMAWAFSGASVVLEFVGLPGTPTLDNAVTVVNSLAELKSATSGFVTCQVGNSFFVRFQSDDGPDFVPQTMRTISW